MRAATYHPQTRVSFSMVVANTLSEALLNGPTRRCPATARFNYAMATAVMAVMAVILLCVSQVPVHHVLLDERAPSGTENRNAVEKLLSNPLQELVVRSQLRGACNAAGAPTGFPVPWSMALATSGITPGSAPSVRSIGIQGITSESIYFVCRGGPGGATGPPADLGTYNASMVFLAGNYPGADFEEQWRAEGVVREVPVGRLSEHGFPPPDEKLVVQILASSAFAQERARATGGSLEPSTGEGRIAMLPGRDSADDAAALAADVAQAGSALSSTARLDAARRAGLRTYALTPRRVEVLAGGPDWPEGPRRFEWSADVAFEGEATWLPPRQILPYSMGAGVTVP